MTNLIFVLVILVLLIICLYTNKLFDYFNKRLVIKENEKYLSLLRFYLDFAYDGVWRSQILTYVTNGIKPSNEELETLSRNFSKLVSELMGPTILKYMIEYFGCEESFWVNVITFFNSKIDKEQLEDYVTKREEK